MCKLLIITKTRTTPYPKSDGLIEGYNRTLATMLSGYVNENHNDWDKHLPYVMMAYRSAVQETTGCTLNRLMLVRENSMLLDLLHEPPRDGSKCLHYVFWRSKRETKMTPCRMKQCPMCWNNYVQELWRDHVLTFAKKRSSKQFQCDANGCMYSCNHFNELRRPRDAKPQNRSTFREVKQADVYLYRPRRSGGPLERTKSKSDEAWERQDPGDVLQSLMLSESSSSEAESVPKAATVEGKTVEEGCTVHKVTQPAPVSAPCRNIFKCLGDGSKPEKSAAASVKDGSTQTGPRSAVDKMVQVVLGEEGTKMPFAAKWRKYKKGITEEEING